MIHHAAQATELVNRKCPTGNIYKFQFQHKSSFISYGLVRVATQHIHISNIVPVER